MAAVTLTGGIVFAGCGSPSRVMPSAPRPGVFLVYGIVVDQSGTCITDAAVTIVGGQRDGEAVKQNLPCSAYAEHSGGFVVRGLSLNEVITLRGSAPGYISQDVNWRVLGPQSQILEFWLLKSE